MHSDISQEKRIKRLDNFKRGTVKIMIATDVAARGLDIPNVELVIQCNPPENPEPYIHRSGRTGRVGRKGKCITILSSAKDRQLMKEI